MSKNILIVAFHFPPMGGSSGVLRSLKFAKYLPNYGWTPTVLSANPRVYDQLDDSGLAEIPDEVEIIRAFGLDAKKHLSIRSRYPRFLAIPDRWSSWYVGAVLAGLRAIRKHKIKVIFSTYPIATAHLVGKALHATTGIPWVADFRDPMIEEGYPSDSGTRRIHQRIEEQTIRRASRLIYTTNSTMCDLNERYPDVHAKKALVISNGYDEADFQFLSNRNQVNCGGQLRLVHGGLIYTKERDPRPFFRAIRRLRDEGALAANRVRIELRGSGSDDALQSIIDELAIGDIVKLLPSMPYEKFLADAASADGLLILQGRDCDRQIPAKVYEYLRLGKPILALTTKTSETASLLSRSGGATIADLHEESELYRELPQYVAAVKSCIHSLPDPDFVRKYSRSWQSKQLAECLDDMLVGD